MAISRYFLSVRGGLVLCAVSLMIGLPQVAMAWQAKWDTYKGGGFNATTMLPIWTANYGPFSSIEEVKQAAYEFCMTTTDYKNPALDCTPHPNHQDTVS